MPIPGPGTPEYERAWTASEIPAGEWDLMRVAAANSHWALTLVAQVNTWQSEWSSYDLTQRVQCLETFIVDLRDSLEIDHP